MTHRDGYGSTDVGDVEHIVPGIMINTATCNRAAPGHSWQITSCAGMSIGEKGMLYGAKVLAATAVKLAEDPELVKKAQEEFKTNMKGKTYKCPIPKAVSYTHLTDYIQAVLDSVTNSQGSTNIKVKKLENNSSVTYKLASGCDVFYEGEERATSSLPKGCMVTLRMKGSQVDRIEAASGDYQAEGTLVALDFGETILMELETDKGETVLFQLNPSRLPTIRRDGEASSVEMCIRDRSCGGAAGSVACPVLAAGRFGAGAGHRRAVCGPTPAAAGGAAPGRQGMPRVCGTARPAPACARAGQRPHPHPADLWSAAARQRIAQGDGPQAAGRTAVRVDP